MSLSRAKPRQGRLLSMIKSRPSLALGYLPERQGFCADRVIRRVLVSFTGAGKQGIPAESEAPAAHCAGSYFFAHDVRVSWLLLEFLKSWQVPLLPCKVCEILAPSQFLTVVFSSLSYKRSVDTRFRLMSWFQRISSLPGSFNFWLHQVTYFLFACCQPPCP